MPKTLSIRGLVLLLGLGLGGCAVAREAPAAAEQAVAKGGGDAPAPLAPTPPGDASKAASMPKTSRKVIRNAELAIEVASPAAAESDVSRLVEGMGGYLASSERQATADEGERSQARVTLSLRVPAARLDEALREIKLVLGFDLLNMESQGFE